MKVFDVDVITIELKQRTFFFNGKYIHPINSISFNWVSIVTYFLTIETDMKYCDA